jgi:hypothetical protein
MLRSPLLECEGGAERGDFVALPGDEEEVRGVFRPQSDEVRVLHLACFCTEASTRAILTAE